jgi:hypothetical protein
MATGTLGLEVFRDDLRSKMLSYYLKGYDKSCKITTGK